MDGADARAATVDGGDIGMGAMLHGGRKGDEVTAAVGRAPARVSLASPRRGEGEREFAFERHHFDHIAGMLYKLTGISLAPHKLEMMYSRLARRLRDLGLRDFDAYCAMLDTPAGESEVGLLVNALTTNLTSFFREAHHFEFLRDHALPEARDRANSAGGRRLRFWSAGCSSGQEPYTIAMVISSALSDLKHWDARILATDIDTRMVATAKAGRYSEESLSTIPVGLRDRHTRRGRDDGMLEMRDELKRLITFKPLNLLERWPMRGPFDAIFCRNVLIYFDRDGRRHVIGKFSDLLPSGGYLFLGHSESLYGVSDRFEQVGATIYRRI